MCTLNYPFLGRNMDELRKNVLRGRYAPIPTFYGQDLSEIIKVCLQIQPANRPTALKLLENSIIVKKIKEFQEIKLEEMGKKDIQLLGTIKVPLNIGQLKNKLPVKHVRRSISVGEKIDKPRPQSATNSRNYANQAIF